MYNLSYLPATSSTKRLCLRLESFIYGNNSTLFPFQAGKLRRACFEFISARPGLVAEPSCLEDLPSSLREELVSLGAWIRDGLLQGETNSCQSKAWIRDGLVYSVLY